MRKRPLLLTATALSALGVGALIAVSAFAAICNGSVPLGAIAPAVPEWCQTPLAVPIDTHVESANAWVDDFNHGQHHAALNNSYARGAINNSDGFDVLHFQHNDHWMVDLEGNADNQYPVMGAAWMRPNRLFNAVAGKLVLEFEFAGPIAGTRNAPTIGDSWPEFSITADPAPGVKRQNGTYIYETFEGYWAFGCRMQQAKHPICALYDNLVGGVGEPRRHWEINQNGGDVVSEVNGGDHAGTGDAIDVAWKSCTSTQDPDTVCRNLHRVEITQNTIKFFVNGVPSYSAVLENNELSNILGSPFYVYFGDFAYQIDPDEVIRFHWDHLAINPEALSGGTPTPTPTATATATATTTPTATPNNRAYRCMVKNTNNNTYTTVWTKVGGGSCP